ncbi:hypothetical protein VNI00_006090 [Paramarasmius palmivorus]|uniref:MFS general substrate transporter n=1 Tax=Paramarasmius palmivorus TaxID=297713 RepID=A0AAW0D8E5_9AGAR
MSNLLDNKYAASAAEKRDIEISEAETSPQASSPEEEPFVEGGFIGWMTVVGAWFCMFGTFGCIFSFGVYQDFYTRIYLTEQSTSSIAWIGSIGLTLPFLFGVFSGAYHDKGYFYPLVWFGNILFVFSLFMLSLAQPHRYYQVFLAQGLGMGLGIGFLFVPCISVPSHFFRRHQGFACGIIVSGISAGAVVLPIMLNTLLPRIGFGPAVRATAYVVLGTSSIGCLLMRARYPPRIQYGPADIRGIMRDAPFFIAICGSGVTTLGLYFPSAPILFARVVSSALMCWCASTVIYMQLFAVLHDIDANLAFYSLAIINGSGGVARLLSSYCADRFGAFNVMIPEIVISGAVILAILGVNGSASLIVVSVIYGFFSGAYLSLVIPAFAAFSRSPAETGARNGFGVGLGSFGVLVASPVQGAILGSEFQWGRTIAFSAAITICGAFIFAIAGVGLAKRLGTRRV